MLSEAERKQSLSKLTESQAKELLYDWKFWGRANQFPPPGSWQNWLIQAGRGFGKTRTGAEWIKEQAKKSNARLAIIGRTSKDVRNTMMQGVSGLLSCYPQEERPHYIPSKGVIVFKSGAIGETFSADKPDQLRGPQFTGAWCDEIAAWQRGEEAWDNLTFGLRLGDNPRAVITTTPKPVKLVKDLVKDPLTHVTRGTTYENKGNLSPKFFNTLTKYEGTRLGRQELLAELLEDLEGALWTLGMIERDRVDSAAVPPLVRCVVAIDPAVTSNENSDETGIVAVGLGANQHLYVLDDYSGRYTPHEWARQAARLMLKWSADRIVGEVNNGGDLVEANLRNLLSTIPFRAVRASRGKLTRAEPVSALYEQHRVHHVCDSDNPSNLAELETQMTTWVPSTGEKSPDRMDALVWAAFDLLIQPEEHYFATIDPHVQVSPY